MSQMDDKKKVVENLNSIFNRYSGKEKLENEIEKLQSHLLEMEIDKKRLEKNETNTKRAIAAKQEAEQKLNEATVRVETLSYQLEELRNKGTNESSFTLIEEISLTIFEPYIKRIASINSDNDSFITAHITYKQMQTNEIQTKLANHLDQNTLQLLKKINSNTGYVLFYDNMKLVCEVIVPPIPITENLLEIAGSFNVEPLTKLLDREMTICVLATHAGESLIGITSDKAVFDEDMVIRSNVKAKHTKGGFSQRRFERLRDEDIAHHADKVRSALKDLLSNSIAEIDMMFLCGDIVLANHIVDGMNIEIPLMERNIDARIEKHDTDNILRSIFSCRRYRL
ncbi:peptide chain release factor-like protein [Methanococcoides sp. SA1]|nr:peptide chain release factor-like protein [Methanococcoides sp. SA1]